MTKSNADRQRAYRQRRAGLVLVRRWVRPELAAQVRAYADALMDGRLQRSAHGLRWALPAAPDNLILVGNEMDDPNMHAYGEDGPNDAEIGRQWRENSSLEKWFPITAERLAFLERWAKDCRDQVLFPAAQREDDIGKAADGLGQALVEFRLGPNVR